MYSPPPSSLEPENRETVGSPLYLGHYGVPENNHLGRELLYRGERHLLLFGPTGCGKSTRLLVSNLLRIQNRSIVVIDPKGELTAITADYRRTLGDVFILNPFNVSNLGSVGFNPLRTLDETSPLFFDDASALAEALIRIEGKDPHWSESAQELLVALLMWEVKEARRQKRDPHLRNVRSLLTAADEYEPDSKGRPQLIKGFRHNIGKMVVEGGFEIESLAGRFLRGNDEMASIQSCADTQTRWLLSTPMHQSLTGSALDFADLKKRPITVYLVLPSERMRTHSVWLRLIIVSALRALFHPGGVSTLFMLDEFAQLGYLGPIEDAFGLVRGYGVQIWPILQDLSQLKSLYKDRYETFLGNAGVVAAFAPNDLTTADWMSRRAGETTVTALGYNQGDSQSNSHNHLSLNASVGLNYAQIKRRLYLPQELMNIPTGHGVLWASGSSKTIPFKAPSYWNSELTKERAKPNPYFNRGRL